jgi:hypothetical protein
MTLRLSHLQLSSGNRSLIIQSVKEFSFTDFFVKIITEYVEYLQFTYVDEYIAIISKYYIAKNEHCIILHKKYSFGILTIILVTGTLFL